MWWSFVVTSMRKEVGWQVCRGKEIDTGAWGFGIGRCFGDSSISLCSKKLHH